MAKPNIFYPPFNYDPSTYPNVDEANNKLSQVLDAIPVDTSKSMETLAYPDVNNINQYNQQAYNINKSKQKEYDDFLQSLKEANAPLQDWNKTYNSQGDYKPRLVMSDPNNMSLTQGIGQGGSMEVKPLPVWGGQEPQFLEYKSPEAKLIKGSESKRSKTPSGAERKGLDPTTNSFNSDGSMTLKLATQMNMKDMILGINPNQYGALDQQVTQYYPNQDTKPIKIGQYNIPFGDLHTLITGKLQAFARQQALNEDKRIDPETGKSLIDPKLKIKGFDGYKAVAEFAQSLGLDNDAKTNLLKAYKLILPKGWYEYDTSGNTIRMKDTFFQERDKQGGNGVYHYILKDADTNKPLAEYSNTNIDLTKVRNAAMEDTRFKNLDWQKVSIVRKYDNSLSDVVDALGRVSIYLNNKIKPQLKAQVFDKNYSPEKIQQYRADGMNYRLLSRFYQFNPK